MILQAYGLQDKAGQRRGKGMRTNTLSRHYLTEGGAAYDKKRVFSA